MTDATAQVTLCLESDDLNESTIRSHELALRRMIRENASGCEIVEETSIAPGAKGDPITLGVIALALIKSGAAVALINCIKATINREKKIKIKVKTKNGRTIEIDASNMNEQAIREQVAELAKA